MNPAAREEPSRRGSPRTGHVVLILLLTAGCSWGTDAARATAEQGPEAPDAVIDVSGSRAPPLRFGAPDAAELSSLVVAGLVVVGDGDAHSVRATFVLLTDAPAAKAVPLDASVRAVVDAGTGELLLASELAREALFLEGVSATELLAQPRATVAGDVRAAFPRDVSVRVALRSERASECGENPARASQEPVPRTVVEVALVLRRDGAGELASTLELARGKREIVLLDPRALAGSPRFAFVVRSPFSTPSGRSSPWLAVAVEIEPKLAPPRAIAELAGSLASERAARERGAPAPPAYGSGETVPVDLAVLRARLEATPRETIAELGRGERAVVALEAALTLPVTEFRSVAAGIERALARRAAVAGADPLKPLGLDVDLAALEVLLSPDLRSSSRPLVERLFGAAFAADLEGAPLPLLPRARLVPDRSGLERLVTLTNLVALDSSRPSVRTRAARFLEPLAPGLEGYDPLGSFEKRSEAVGRLWTRLTPEESRP